MKSAKLALLSAALVVGATLPASAFNYPEHAHISYDALRLLSTVSCGAGAADNCAQIGVLLQSLALHLGGPNTCPIDKLMLDQPPDCLALSDIPALAGDHAASPLLTKWRWFDTDVCSESQSALARGLPRIVAAFDTSRRSPETTRVHAPDREAFLSYIRKFAPSSWPRRQGPSDLELFAYDDSYVALAERGHPHFRPPLSAPSSHSASQRSLVYYPQFDPERERSKPDNNAFAWYADQHLGALRLAFAGSQVEGRDRAVLLAVAVFLELNAWHYLQDSVASGHMVGNANELNNAALTATHNHYGTSGVLAEVPEPLCRAISNHAWQASLPALAETCANPTRLGTLYGDHQLMQLPLAPTAAKPWQLTYDWAVALAALSLEEVANASRGSWHGPPPVDAIARCIDAPIDDRAYTWTERNVASPGVAERERLGFYKCLFSWWEGDDGLAHARWITAQFPTSAFEAMRWIPVPKPPEPDEYPQVEFYGGNSVALSLLGHAYERRGSSSSQVAGGLGLAYALAVPRTLAPIQVALGARLEFGASTRRVAGDLLVRRFFGTTSPLYFGAQVDSGFDWSRRKYSAGLDVIPIGAALLDLNKLQSFIELRAGYVGLAGWRAGLSTGILF